MDTKRPANKLDSNLESAFKAAGRRAESPALEEVQARLGRAIFGAPAEPLRVGRFVVLERLGVGGMAVVFAAYDPELDRRVAIKLLRARVGQNMERARERLEREARALARISHPNVVPIHEVGVVDGHLFLVMEYVAGQTLGEWCEELPASRRRWQEVLTGYVQAGRGLDAVHQLGIVHRDFKPSNAVRGGDGRVRVVDFGLARGRAGGRHACADTDPEEARPAFPDDRVSQLSVEIGEANQLPGPLTDPGAKVGTPAYMAPEQFAGQEVGPAADQFAFCVALYEALYGCRPYAGVTLSELQKNVEAGSVREPPGDSSVPRWVYDALRRGLCLDPGERYPSMEALLAELTRNPARRWRWVGSVAVLTVLGVLLAWSLMSNSTASAPAVCQDGDDSVAAVWNPESRSAFERAATATKSPYADRVVSRVVTGLDAYSAELARAYDNGCMAYRRGARSDSLYDRQRACLESRQEHLNQAVAVLGEIDGASLGRAMDVVASLPAVAYCMDNEVMAASVPPPHDAHVAGQVELLRDRLAAAWALEMAGRLSDAREAVAAVIDEAEKLPYAPVRAEALHALGRIALVKRDMPGAIEPLERAIELGMKHKMWPLAVEATARLLYVQGIFGAADTSAEVIAARASLIEPLSQNISDRGFARPLLLNNLGAVEMARGNKEKARELFTRARDAMAETRDTQLELVNVVRNLAMVTSAPDEREELAETAWRSLRDALGEEHPFVLRARMAQAHYTGDPAQSRALLEPVCAMFRQFHADIPEAYARCSYYLAFLTAECGDLEAAGQIMSQAAVAAVRVSDGKWLENLAGGYAAHYRGDHNDALALFGAVLDNAPASDRWWFEARIAQAHLGLGLSQRALGRAAPAIDHLDRARAIFARLQDINEDVETRQRLALARQTLAHVLCQSGQPGEGARELFARAEHWYRASRSGYEARLKELTAWRDACAPSAPGRP